MLISKIKNLFSDSLYNKIFTNSFWIILSNIISKCVLLIATIIMAKYLGKEQYGQFGIIKSTLLMFVMFASLELGLTATKYIAQYKNSDKIKVEKIIGISNLFALLIGFSFSSLVYIFANIIAYHINAPEIYQEIKLASLIIFFASINGIQNGILAGLENFKELSINNAIAGVISSISLVITSKYFDLKMVVVAFGLNYLLLFIFNYCSLRKVFYSQYDVNIFRKKNFEEINILWKFSLPAILAGLMVSPVVWLCNYFLVNQPSGYVEMAEFDIANQWRNTILFIPAALSQIALPLLTSALNDNTNYKKIFNLNIKINFYLGFIMTVTFVALSPFIIDFYGENYERAIYPLIIMFTTTFLITINNVIGQAIASQGKMWYSFYVNTIWAIVLIICSYILIVKYQLGAIGLSLAFLISYIIHTPIQFLLIREKL